MCFMFLPVTEFVLLDIERFGNVSTAFGISDAGAEGRIIGNQLESKMVSVCLCSYHGLI